MDVWVVTASIPERSELLAEAIRSVDAQAYQPIGHLIRVDNTHRGPVLVRNSLIRLVPPDAWVAFLDDDDTWEPDHLAELHDAQCATGADVVYSLATITGRPGWDPQREVFDADALRAGNYIPLSGVVRAGLLQSVGGFPPGRYEDHMLWLALLDAGAQFHCVPKRTWTYRFGSWDSRSKECWDGRR